MHVESKEAQSVSVGVCVASAEGIVLVTDSRRTVETGGVEPRFEVASETARKLFLVDNRLAVATHGQAVIGGETIGALMEQFEGPGGSDGVGYANALGRWFSKRLSEATQPRRGDLANAKGMRWPLGFVVVGFDGDIGRVHGVSVRAGDFQVEPRNLSTEVPGVYSFGQSDGIDRLLAGVDRRALKQAKISMAEEEEIKLDLLSYELIVPEDLSEAVAFAESLVEVQLLAQNFSRRTYASKEERVPGCGGRIRAIVIAKDRGTWVQGAPTSPPKNPRGAPPPADEAPLRAQQSG